MDNLRKIIREILEQAVSDGFLLREEMEVSDNFNKGNFGYIADKHAVFLEVGINPEDNELHRLNLIVSIGCNKPHNPA